MPNHIPSLSTVHKAIIIIVVYNIHYCSITHNQPFLSVRFFINLKKKNLRFNQKIAKITVPTWAFINKFLL